jgi:preprotein translocase subunit SecG
MESILVVIDVLAAIGIIGLVLIQQGKGADMGASFGSGASQTLFGSAGSGNVLTRTTTWLAVIFFASSLGLTVLSRTGTGVVTDDTSLLADPTATEAAAPASTALPDLGAAPAETAVEAAPVASEAAATEAAASPAVEAAAPAAPAPVEPAAETPQN